MATRTNGPRSKRQAEQVRRLFKGLPIINGEQDLPIHVGPAEVKDGKPGSFGDCTIALGARALYGSTAVAIFRSRAYLDLVNPRTGQREVWRMVIPRRTRDAVIAPLDGGRPPTPGTYWLSKPAVWDDLDVKRDRNRGYRIARREALLRGEVPERAGGSFGSGGPRNEVVTLRPGEDGFMRDGRGMVQNRVVPTP